MSACRTSTEKRRGGSSKAGQAEELAKEQARLRLLLDEIERLISLASLDELSASIQEANRDALGALISGEKKKAEAAHRQKEKLRELAEVVKTKFVVAESAIRDTGDRAQ